MKGRSADVVFQGIERDFNTPAEAVEVCKIGEREAISREVGNEVFVDAIGDFETNDA